MRKARLSLLGHSDQHVSLRSRSAFAITAALYVGKMIEDAGKPSSEAQYGLREHAEDLGEWRDPSPALTGHSQADAVLTHRNGRIVAGNE